MFAGFIGLVALAYFKFLTITLVGFCGESFIYICLPVPSKFFKPEVSLIINKCAPNEVMVPVPKIKAVTG